ncbi:MAG: dockerin type I repeat-containing protein [Ruminococcus sp.]|nr:dockerin type I repeat-containing protein [Ruminococcus sp.]
MKKLVSFLLVSAVLITAFVLPVGAVRVEELYGDVNKDGSVDTIDATIVQRHLVGVSELVSLEYALADFDNDKDVSILDASAIQMYNAKMIKHPRKYEEYLEFFVEIDDISIESVYGPEIVEDKSVRFTVLYNEEYDDTDAGKLVYNYTFSGITDESYQTTYEKDSENYISWSFPSAGIYEIKVEVRRKLYPEVYSFTKRFEVLEGFKFDGKRFVDNTKVNWFYTMPKDTVDLDYETLVDVSQIHMKENYGHSSVSDDFLALVKSKAEYDKLFEIDNTHFDDEFFETKSLVVAVTQGIDYYSIAPITKVARKDNKLYVEVNECIDSPDPDIGLPVAPLYYAFVAVDKADVENIEYVERAESRFEFVEPYNYRDNYVYFNKGRSGYEATLEKFSQYGVVEIKRVDDYSYILVLDKHDVQNVIDTIQAMQDDEELWMFHFSPVFNTNSD